MEEWNRKAGILEYWNGGRLEDPEVRDQRTGISRSSLPICLPAMANSHDLDHPNLFVNFINDPVVADSDSPVIL